MRLILPILVVAAISLASLSTPAPLAPPPPPPPMGDPAPCPPCRGYVCYRASRPPVIDGKLDDAVWQDAPWSENFIDIEGASKPVPRLRTRFKMLWDNDCLYIAAELEEPNVWATLTKHDCVIFQDNDFEVFLDPDGHSDMYAELELNALNTTWDLLLTKPYKDGGRAINAWEITGLRSAVHVDGTLNDPRDRDRGWSVEIAWPWKGLKELTDRPVPPHDGDQWRMNFSRVEWDTFVNDEGKTQKCDKRPEHNWVWSPQGVIDMHRPECWGYVQFSKAPPGKATFSPDRDAAIRDVLHRVYYAQRDYRKRSGKGRTLDPLEVHGPWPMGADAPCLQTTDSMFEACMTVRRAGQTPLHWHIRDDAKVWSSSEEEKRR